MKINRHERKKEEILNTAFWVWSQNHFADMTLQQVTDEMGMTKQAIYRYYKGKDDLLAAMAERVYQLAVENSRELDELTLGEDSLEQKITRSLDFYSDMLMEHSVIMRFSGYLYRKRKEDADRINEIHEEAFQRMARNLDIPLVAVHYLNSMFVLLFSISKEPIEVGHIVDIFMNGIKGKAYQEIQHRQQILDKAENWNFQNLFKTDIQRAVYQALRDACDVDVSLERVAEKAGMKKSSLYNYFSSKEEMLRTTVYQLRESLVLDQNDFIRELNGIEEKLFGNFVYTEAFFREFPDTIDIMDRLMSLDYFSQKEKEDDLIAKSEYVSLVKQAVETDILQSLKVDYRDVSKFVNLALILEIRYLHFKKIRGRDRQKFLLDLYILQMHGLNGLRREK